MTQFPEDIRQMAQREPRFLDVDRAERSTPEGRQDWWRGLTDTTNCYDPEEIASALRDKGWNRAEADAEVVWLRPARDGESDGS